MTTRRTFLGAALAGVMATTGAWAQDFTLTLEHFLPPQANVPRLVLDVWADRIEAESDGRIKIERYPAMQLGGTPPELVDHIADGIVDIGWTVIGYTPGRFPRTEVFELPFFVDDARAASYAFWKLYEQEMQAEFSDVKPLGLWVHGPGMFHTKEPVAVPGDLAGMKIRGGSRLVNDLLSRVGAEPIGMPVPAVAEALSKGVIDGTTIPWEVTTALKVPELVSNHTEFDGPGLYTLTFLMGMNQSSYDALPDDLKQVIDDNSGLSFSVFAGGTQADADAPAREIAVGLGNNIFTVTEEQAKEWGTILDPIYADWIADLDGKGIDAQKLIDDARAFMAEYSSDMDNWAK